ncbi:MAG: hypothetical protein LUH07_04325 [Lachnospiraceae bacterium]|nr:hypothetical protein [Lachnospiraceae bacterium]
MSEAADIPVQYARDKPKDCRYCFLWSRGKVGCRIGGKKNCFYLIRQEQVVNDKCYQCPYSKGAPCIGWCTADAIAEIRQKRNSCS